jgi:acyl-CoA reductase-like NAD-dependent aldehyde dehydrogenase
MNSSAPYSTGFNPSSSATIALSGSRIAPTLDFGLLKFRSKQAQLVWEGTSARERRTILHAVRKTLVSEADTLAKLVASSRGCSQAEALATEILPLADGTKYLSKSFTHLLAPKRLGKRDRPGWLTGVDCEVHRQPLGLVLIISPGNYPLFLAAVQSLQALAAGNAIWIKPAPGTSGLIKKFRDVLVMSGVDKDLVQLLPDTIEATEAAIQAGVDKVVFTGSAETGRKILSQLAPRLTPAVMELSGCDSVFVRPDADLQRATEAIRFGLTLNNGRTCIAPKRIFVPRRLLAGFSQKIREGLSTATPIHLAPEKCRPWLSWVKEALADGAFIISGTLHSNRIDGPMILGGATPEMRLLKGDTFAPVASIVAVDSDSEALSANELCPFSLSASVFGTDLNAARRLAGQIRAGSVLVNDLIAPTADPRVPFGGIGESGFGTTRGNEGLLEMTTPKVVITNRSRFRMHYRDLTEEDTPLFHALLRMSHGPSWRDRGLALLSALSLFKNSNNKKNESQS